MDKAIKAIKDVLTTIENHDFFINVYEEGGNECGLELETWTSGGVNMIHFLDFRYATNGDEYRRNILCPFAICEEVKEIACNFDVDDEIDRHRQDERYREAFTCSQSVHDFEEYQKRLRLLAKSVFDIVYGDIEKKFTEFDFEDLGVTMRGLLKEDE